MRLQMVPSERVTPEWRLNTLWDPRKQDRHREPGPSEDHGFLVPRITVFTDVTVFAETHEEPF